MRFGQSFFARLTLVLTLSLVADAAQARVKITIDLSRQMMHVVAGSGESHDWTISSGRAGFATPVGVYGVSRLEANHRSKKYNNAPMPHSIFFQGGYAIHGSYDLGSLGRPVSHGCVRLEPANAALLYALVEKEGAIIAVKGAWTGSSMVAEGRGKPRAARAVETPAVAPPAPEPAPAPAGPLDLLSGLFR